MSWASSRDRPCFCGDLRSPGWWLASLVEVVHIRVCWVCNLGVCVTAMYVYCVVYWVQCKVRGVSHTLPCNVAGSELIVMSELFVMCCSIEAGAFCVGFFINPLVTKKKILKHI